MNKLLFLYLSLLSIILMSATCAEVPQNQSNENDCIDTSKINPNGICTMEYAPVCGCDEKTYSNDCVATNAGVTKWTTGTCEDKATTKTCIDKSKINPKQPCTKQYEPVCGCDDKDYGNPCMAEKAGVTTWKKGKCINKSTKCIDKSKINPKQPCTKQYEPVCGCNNKNYSNPCMAEKAGVMTWKKGKCPIDTTDCIDPSKIKKSPCPDLFQQVCGCDNKTYTNSCEAKNNGLASWKKGKCPK